MYLGMLTVSPELQARGIGKELLKAAEEYAVTKSCFSMVMTVITLRNELIELYMRRGYRDTGERKPFPGDPRFGIPKQPLEFLVMEKPLKRGWEV
jgi:ribosomal protein S18 acetylase RimI-like enzyme